MLVGVAAVLGSEVVLSPVGRCVPLSPFMWGVGGVFTFACTAWWRVTYLLFLVVSRLKGVLGIWPDSCSVKKTHWLSLP